MYACVYMFIFLCERKSVQCPHACIARHLLSASVSGMHISSSCYICLCMYYIYLGQNNAFLEDYKPWLLVKDIQQHHLLLSVLLLSLECLRMSAIHLWPVLPSSSEKMASKLRLQFPFCAEDLKCQFRNDFSQLSSIADVDLTSKCVLFQKTNH